MSLFSRLGRKYLDLLKVHPVKTKAMTSFTLMAAADVAVQSRSEEPLDPIRTLRFASFGFVFGPAGHAWYGFLERVFKPSASLAGLVKSVSVDQLIFAPIILGTFFTYLCALEGKGAEATRQKISQDLPPTIVSPKISSQVNNWFLWVPTQIINFKYVPEFLRLPVVSSVALLWNIYLAVMTNKPVKPREADNRFKHDNLETT
ncbi:hypothetical protein NDN08_008092 [Rhodosorus marinus]|uniref:Peroxisomal membrane protein MPV17 n=1 Tax=Rhodosorus marinus TaxID=101924 RepID=A0AAV8V4D0_9RHOD|nr:hypothetical protein NDN08_008092 [Rhodosorus marinus]